jgi:hypothetical protein
MLKMPRMEAQFVLNDRRLSVQSRAVINTLKRSRSQRELLSIKYDDDVIVQQDG